MVVGTVRCVGRCCESSCEPIAYGRARREEPGRAARRLRILHASRTPHPALAVPVRLPRRAAGRRHSGAGGFGAGGRFRQRDQAVFRSALRLLPRGREAEGGPAASTRWRRISATPASRGIGPRSWTGSTPARCRRRSSRGPSRTRWPASRSGSPAQLTEAESARQAAVGEKVSFRRLSREEYRNTIRDLLGVTYDASDPAGLPEDPDWQGFERIGSVLTLSPAHVEKYLAAAETVLNEALALGPQPKVDVTRWTAAEMRVPGDVGERTGRARAARQGARRHRAEQRRAGRLRPEDQDRRRIRRPREAQRPAPGGRPAPRLRLYATDIGRTLFEQDVEAPEDQPVDARVPHAPAGRARI